MLSFLEFKDVSTNQSQKTQGFCVADFATQSDERRSRSKFFPLFIWIKEPCVRKSEGLERSELLGISQTKTFPNYMNSKFLYDMLDIRLSPTYFWEKPKKFLENIFF